MLPAGIVPAGEGDHELVSLQYTGLSSGDRSFRADIYVEQMSRTLEEAVKRKEGPTRLQAVGEEREGVVAFGAKGTLSKARRGRNVRTDIRGKEGWC